MGEHFFGLGQVGRMGTYQFGVVTRVPDPGDAGNMALAPVIYLQTDPGDLTKLQPLHEALGQPAVFSLFLRAPVFTLGEILVTIGGREVAGHGRKPAKWSGVDVEWFDDIDAAAQRAVEVCR